jgi:Calcineurin-like phosphoesterase
MIKNPKPARAASPALLLFGLCVLSGFVSRAAAPAPASEAGAPFTIVMLPDTQHYSRRYPELFMAQTEWIKANRDKENIAFVTHVGDVVNDRKKGTNEWLVAQKAMSVLDGVVPWGVSIGNHDFDGTACRPDQATCFLKYFGPQRFRRYPWFGGASTNGLNTCQLFSAGGVDFIILHLELDVPDFAIQWASEVLQAHPNRAAIVTTHSYLNAVSGTNGYNDAVSKYGNSGQDVWNKLVRCHPQIFLVLCGHHQRTVAYHQISTNDAGHKVVEMLADYQKGHNGGDAFLRLLRFLPDQGEIAVRTYSPALEEFKTDPKNQFTVPLDLPACCRPARAATLTP